MRWSDLAAIHVILRLCSPSSDLAIAEDVYRKTALEDLLGVPVQRVLLGQRRALDGPGRVPVEVPVSRQW